MHLKRPYMIDTFHANLRAVNIGIDRQIARRSAVLVRATDLDTEREQSFERLGPKGRKRGRS